MKTVYQFNKSVSVNPVKRDGIYIQLNYDLQAIINQPFPEVGIKNLRFAREDVKLFYDWKNNNSTGIFYAPYFDIILSGSGYPDFDIQMYIDLTDKFMYSNDGVEVSLKKYFGIDWLEAACDGFTFESIALTPLTAIDLQCQAMINARTYYVPYVISTIPNYVQGAVGILSCFSLFMMLQKETDVITSIFTPNALGFFTTAPAIIGFIIHLAYIVILAIALWTTFEMTLFSLIQPTKYHAIMFLSDLIEITCVKLGLQFQSSIFQQFPYNQIAFLAEKYNPVASGASQTFSIVGLSLTNIVGGYTQPTPSQQVGYPLMTGGDILSLAKLISNGKIILQNNTSNKPTLILERRDYVPNAPKWKQPDIREDWNGFNTNEFFATTIISFEKDTNDKNTFDQYAGQKLSIVTQPTLQPDPLLVLTKGLRKIDIPAARGIRKENLTNIEAILNGFINDVVVNTIGNIIYAYEYVMYIQVYPLIAVWDAIIAVLHTLGIINSATKARLHISLTHNWATNPFLSLQNTYGNRIGYLLMEHDFVNVPKLILLDTNAGFTVNGCKCFPVHKQNSQIVNSLYIWSKYYCIDSWVPIGSFAVPTYTDVATNTTYTINPNTSDNGKHNQYTLWKPALNSSSDTNKLLIQWQDFNLLYNNMYFEDAAGNPRIMDSMNWYLEDGWADIADRKNEIYSQNLSQIITLPDGD